MKRIILVSCYIIACLTMVSCTNDEMETNPNIKQQVSADAAADTGGGSTGQTPTTPPKP